ncbi:MAG: aminopeptidase P family protein [Candidatus Cryptobacteroides sp.]
MFFGNNRYADRITQLREMMASRGWDAVVVGASDPHASEYIAPHWQQVRWLTGFSSEAADVVITASHAGLWTDSRYFIQAEKELSGTGVELHKTRMPDSVNIPEWLAAQGIRSVAVDGTCQTVDFVGSLRAALGDAALIEDCPDFISELWPDRPKIPFKPIVTQDVESFGGIPRREKIGWLREWMEVHKIDIMLLSSLDEIAWLLNVRGSDIEYNPLVISYLTVSRDEVAWYVMKDFEDDVPADTADSFYELEQDGVKIDYYSNIDYAFSAPGRIFVDPATLNYHIYSLLGGCDIISGTSPIILQKAIKCETEIASLRQTFVEDGAAVESFIYWLENELNSGREVNEWQASLKLTEFRSKIPGYRGNSFENISAYGANAALPHYSTPKSGSAQLSRRGLYLSDSGGQYLTGTTDITRTVPMGKCSELEMEDYTLVLKGMIDLAMAIFPEGTAGCQIDALARAPLWQAKRNFGHGTGHGIGFWLCVHEGPQSIRQNFNPQPMVPGMVTSDEPALYREGKHGIRHENIILCVETGSSEFGRWLGFETLTCCHIDTSAIVPELLGEAEIEWLNAYNDKVYNKLKPYLAPVVRDWLYLKTRPITL